MSALLRAALLGLGLLAVHQQVRWLGLAEPDTRPLALLESRAAGMGLTNVRPVFPDVDYVTAFGCGAIIRLGVYTADGDEDARIAPLLTPDVTALFIYIGRTAPRRAALHPVQAWLAANAAAVLGRRESRPPARFVLALLPVSCPGLAGLDWAMLSP